MISKMVERQINSMIQWNECIKDKHTKTRTAIRRHTADHNQFTDKRILNRSAKDVNGKVCCIRTTLQYMPGTRCTTYLHVNTHSMTWPSRRIDRVEGPSWRYPCFVCKPYCNIGVKIKITELNTEVYSVQWRQNDNKLSGFDH